MNIQIQQQNHTENMFLSWDPHRPLNYGNTDIDMGFFRQFWTPFFFSTLQFTLGGVEIIQTAVL